MTWREPWPPWASRGWGYAMRVLIGVLGAASGIAAVVLANFSATFKKTPPEWNFENVSLFVLGLMIGSASLWAAFRPSRLSMTTLGASIVGLFVVGAAV